MPKQFILFLFIFYSTSLFSQTYRDSIETYREKYKSDFLSEERSPVKSSKEVEQIFFYMPDERYRIIADVNKTANAIPFELPTINGKTKPYIEYATLSFLLKRKKYTLKVYQSLKLIDNPEYKDHLFLPFTDETNGGETYINGRYLDLSVNDIHDNKIEIDFNKAYNPYCAYSSGYSCPKPPEENNLRVKIIAGEKNFKGTVH